MAVHIEIARPILLPGGVLLIPELGAYYLELEQDKHQLIGVNIPDTSRSSALLKAGLKWRGAVGCVEECPVQPWFGLAVTRELKDLPPQGPPLAFSHGIAGQRYTLFPKKGFVDSPAEFPNKWTAIASGGVDVRLGESNWWLSGSFVSRVNDEYRDVQGMVTLRLRI
jgi:hypothetical protein